MDEVLSVSVFDAMRPEYGWIIAALALVAFIVFSFAHRRRTDGPSPRHREQQPESFAKLNPAVPQEMERLLGDLQELSRHINTTIDEKFSKLEQSIAEADKRISTLRILLQNTKDGGSRAVSERSGPPLRSPLPSRVSPALNILIGDEGVEEGPTRSEALDRPPQGETDPHRQVYELADRGRSVMEIAREMRKSPGEVELILKLRRR